MEPTPHDNTTQEQSEASGYPQPAESVYEELKNDTIKKGRFQRLKERLTSSEAKKETKIGNLVDIFCSFNSSEASAHIEIPKGMSTPKHAKSIELIGTKLPANAKKHANLVPVPDGAPLRTETLVHIHFKDEAGKIITKADMHGKETPIGFTIVEGPAQYVNEKAQLIITGRRIIETDKTIYENFGPQRVPNQPNNIKDSDHALLENLEIISQAFKAQVDIPN